MNLKNAILAFCTLSTLGFSYSYTMNPQVPTTEVSARSFPTMKQLYRSVKALSIPLGCCLITVPAAIYAFDVQESFFAQTPLERIPGAIVSGTAAGLTVGTYLLLVGKRSDEENETTENNA